MRMVIGIALMMKVFHSQKINQSMNKQEATRLICFFIAKQIKLKMFLNDKLFF